MLARNGTFGVEGLIDEVAARGLPIAMRSAPGVETVVPVVLTATDRIAANAAKLAAAGGGRAIVSALLALLNKEKAAVDLVVIVLDNESWVDAKRNGPTAMMQE
ncbi:hypothetical protein GCM10007897_20170 [Sphingobium jiangsuense]|uniref:Putative dehydrogenase n=1 Tax=Sphingobium jiangsuense TaxID=870476 RepID=A0A7W6BGR9_9SPHN|nr:hypothetical protein [Sphingobium jiangsuense]MBB3926686.1 putative dehydrogenase [Sphingobium jiangsuense]GLT00628.1 hypothetical protein GCM10007897_20170 [Sphingobium jiangsuense]